MKDVNLYAYTYTRNEPYQSYFIRTLTPAYGKESSQLGHRLRGDLYVWLGLD